MKNHRVPEVLSSVPRRSVLGRRVIAMLLALVLFAAACGSTNDETQTTAAVDTTAESDASTSGSTNSGARIDSGAAEAETGEAEDAATSNEVARELFSVDAAEAMADDAEAEFVTTEAAVDQSVVEAADGDAEGLFADESIEPEQRVPEPDPDRLIDNRFQDYGYREFIDAEEDRLSTFALDVDTGSYTVTRRWLEEGVLPPPEAVRVEELVNYFDYDYDVPRRGLDVTVEGGPSPFDRDNYLVSVGVQAEIIEDGERPPVALTFVIDTSGSMDRDDRLGLVKDSLSILVNELRNDDTVAIVIYSDESGVVLEPTSVRDRDEILDAIDDLEPGGSTNLESGLRAGYDLAREAFREGGINRVIIASDGVANAGITDERELASILRADADAGIQLVTVGYGMGNFNDVTMEQLADNGDGFYAYVDTIDEAERLFQEELTSTLVTAAIDAKIQVEFDPEIVSEYRLVGFENRGVRDSEFRNDAVDAGELGAGHQVTAVYELELQPGVDITDRGEAGVVYLRWEDPNSGDVIEIDEDIDLRDIVDTFGETSESFQLATVVTSFAEKLRDNPYADGVDLQNVLVEAERVANDVDAPKVRELVDLIDRANDLS